MEVILKRVMLLNLTSRSLLQDIINYDIASRSVCARKNMLNVTALYMCT